jgi:hypothetical protein
MSTTRKKALDRQRVWAAARGIAIDPQGYTHRLDDNLLQPLSAAARAEFSRGKGDELGRDGGRGKMQALHSSAALAVNAFDHWRERPRDALRSALGLDRPIAAIEFERTFPTGLRGVPPHLDVTLSLEDGAVVAIESKFLEPYPARKGDRPWRSAYFPEVGGLWDDAGLPGCQGIAEGLRSGDLRYRHLDAAQLLKHALGLARTVQGDYALWYLWYDGGTEEDTTHREEIDDFAGRADARLRFRAMTYRDLFEMLNEAGAERQYVTYLTGRYG